MGKTRLIVARHGNTFQAGETPTRVGAKTDLDLVPSGQEQARILGLYLKAHNLNPDIVIAAGLKRAFNTAAIAVESAGLKLNIAIDSNFNEIDYGPDENKTEEEVVSRIGQGAIDSWNKDAVVPNGWNVKPDQIIEAWHELAKQCREKNSGKTTMVVTSNGIARFSPHITGDFEGFCKNYSIKISTGAICVFEFDGNSWKVCDWNVKPKDWFDNRV
jgi:probable phosphoglycerate mutase